MDKESAPENVIEFMDAAIRKEHDTKTAAKFFLNVLAVVDNEPEILKLLILDHVGKLLSSI